MRVDSLLGRLNSIAAIAGDEIPVKRHDNGQLIGSKINGGKVDEDDKTGINDDAWIETVVDAATNTISIHHKFNRIKNGNTFTDLRAADDWGHDTTDSIDMNNTDDDFNIVTPIIDDMGHVVGENTQTITLPYNFKTIKTNGVSAATTNPLVTENVDIVADNSKDDLTIAAGNKWIRMANNSDNDTLTIGHEVHAFTTTSKGTTNLNEEDDAIDEDNINIPDWDYDEAGHIKSKQDHYYTLPFGFKTITIGDESTSIKNVSAAAGNVVADNT
jgi:poly(3-hydroxybutyrate) depolymerase